MLKITLNGQERRLDPSLRLDEALQGWGYQGRSFAVAVNRTFVPRSRYGETVLNDGDDIEIVSPLSGG
jgi:sulfur carrier protein